MAQDIFAAIIGALQVFTPHHTGNTGRAALIDLSAQGVDSQHTFWRSMYSKHTGLKRNIVPDDVLTDILEDDALLGIFVPTDVAVLIVGFSRGSEQPLPQDRWSKIERGMNKLFYTDGGCALFGPRIIDRAVLP